MRRSVWWCLLGAMLTLVAAGCGDSNLFEGLSDESGYEADKEAGLRAMRDRNWPEAVRVFKQLYDAGNQTPEVKKYLAGAYAGSAGFDALSLVEAIADAQEDGGESVIYDSVTRMLAGDDGFLSADDLALKRSLLTEAVSLYDPGYKAARTAARANGVDTAGLTETEIFQSGLYAAVHAILSVAEQLRVDSRRILTLPELAKVPGAIVGMELPPELNRDLDWVERAKLSLIRRLGTDAEDDDDNDIAAEFDGFLADLGYYQPDAGDRDVTLPELRAYLDKLIAGL